MSEHAALRMQVKRSPLAAAWSWGRVIILAVILGGLVSGFINYFIQTEGVAALDFTPRIIADKSGLPGVLGIASGDIDGDGDVDIVTAGLDGIKVYINTDNKFAAKLVDDKAGERLQLVDLTGDGRLDILVVMKSPYEGVRWYRNNGSVEFSGTQLLNGKSPVAYAADIDADKNVDILTSTLEGDKMIFRRWMNNGSGVFSQTILSSDSGVRGITVADVDNNGYPDIITGGDKGLQRWKTSNGHNWDRIDLDDGNLTQRYLAAADLDGDGLVDIIAAEPGHDRVIWYRNIDTHAFKRILLADDVDAVTVQAVDLDGDGDLDVVAALQDDDQVVWFEQKSDGSFSKRIIAEKLQSVFGVSAVDLDGDGDLDIVTGNHWQGAVYWYERVRSKPLVVGPSGMVQSTKGDGLVTFKLKVRSGDLKQTRLRVQYSLNGDHWYKPWMTSINTSAGSASLVNSQGYQIGTNNGIDTDEYDEVTITAVWDTKTGKNTGGPIAQKESQVQLRVIPRDDIGLGEVSRSESFAVDNAPPNLGNLGITQHDATSVKLGWRAAVEEDEVKYEIHYGEDNQAVMERRAEVWGVDEDALMVNKETNSTTVTNLSSGKLYTFRLWGTDKYGNTSATNMVRLLIDSRDSSESPLAATVVPDSLAESGVVLIPTSERFFEDDGESPLLTTSPVFSPTMIPEATVSPSPLQESPVVSPGPLRSFVASNQPPRANAGDDLTVTVGTIVILDGTRSSDPEGEPLFFFWRQVDGPKVELLSESTATPSFTAGREENTYLFALTVKDNQGLVDTDTVVVSVEQFHEIATEDLAAVSIEEVKQKTPFMRLLVVWSNRGLFVLAALLTLIGVYDRLLQKLKSRTSQWLWREITIPRGGREQQEGKVIEHRSGRPIASAVVTVKNEVGTILARQRSSPRGLFRFMMPPGNYRVQVKAPGYAFSPVTALPQEDGAVVYAGGVLRVQGDKPLMKIVMPMKPVKEAVGSLSESILRIWQWTQQHGHALSWPLFVGGALFNTGMLLFAAEGEWLAMEVGYVFLIMIKLFLELRLQPSYGVVRDAITRVPLDLAVVRLYEHKTNRLVMTRVTDAKGKFFALPPAGLYRVTVMKSGYAAFVRDNVSVREKRDTILQLKIDLVPVAPQAQMLAARI
jgi:hypothetical protein